jgi:hypothetical protein
MKPSDRVFFAVGLIGILCLPGIGLAISPTVEDGDFSTGWDTDVLEETVGCLAGFQHCSTGGNPGPHMMITTETVMEAAVKAYMWKTDFCWVPATDGEICTVTMEIDERAEWSFGQGQTLWIVVVQGGEYYMACNTITLYEQTWETFSLGPATFDDFVGAPPPWPYDPSVHPDFSAGGEPIYFGFMVGNRSTCDAVSHRYDNWRIWVGLQPSEIDRGSWGGIKALYR